MVTIPLEDKPIGIVTERDLVRQVCTKDVSSNLIIADEIMSHEIKAYRKGLMRIVKYLILHKHMKSSP